MTYARPPGTTSVPINLSRRVHARERHNSTTPTTHTSGSTATVVHSRPPRRFMAGGNVAAVVPALDLAARHGEVAATEPRCSVLRAGGQFVLPVRQGGAVPAWIALVADLGWVPLLAGWACPAPGLALTDTSRVG